MDDLILLIYWPLYIIYLPLSIHFVLYTYNITQLVLVENKLNSKYNKCYIYKYSKFTLKDTIKYFDRIALDEDENLFSILEICQHKFCTTIQNFNLFNEHM